MKTYIHGLLRYKKNHLFLFFMLTSLVVYSGPPDWETPTNMEYSMEIIAVLQLEDGTFSTNGNDMVAGFDEDDKCRGVASPSNSPGIAGIIRLTIKSNQYSGEIIYFEAYLADEDDTEDLDQAIVFEHKQTIGSIKNPFIFTFDSDFEYYLLSLTANPAEGGSPAGSGFYEEKETVNISANVNDNYIFTKWTGDTEYMNDPLQASTTVTMPDDDVELTANFIPQAPLVKDVTETYDGTEYTVMASVPDGFTLRWYDAAEGGSITTIPTATNAGTYIAWAVSVDSNDIESERVQATLTINKRSLTITANDQTKAVGQEFVFDGTEFTSEGLIDNSIDKVTSVTLTSEGAPAGADVGTYSIIPSNAMGNGLGNYNISYINGTLTVTDKIELTIEGLTVADKTYDGNTSATITKLGTLEGIDDGDDVAIDQGAVVAQFSDKNAGIKKTVNISKLILTGDDAYKYVIKDFNVTASISPRELVLSNFTANNKVYDGTTNATGGAFQDDRIDGDVLNFSFNYAFENANARTNKQVLFTNIAISGGTDQDNYTLATTTGNATATISPRQLSIKADDKTKKFGEDDPALTWTLTAGSLVSGDAITGQLQRQSGEAVGTYTIRQGTLTAGRNYSISFTPGVFSIVPADLIVTIQPQAAVTAGAQWSIDGKIWYNSQVALPLEPGDYTVEFSDIDADAWYTPEPIDISHGAQTEITGTYLAKQFLTMLAPDGNGNVSPEPGTYDFPAGETVNLSASAGENWIFQHWLINGSIVTNNPYNLHIAEDVTVQAVFNETLIDVLLTINVSGEGTVNINGNEYTQPMIFAEGSQITLEALAAAGYYFVEWEDDLSGNTNPVTLTIDDDKTITAVFIPEDFSVSFIVKDENDQDITDAIITFDGTVYPAGQYLIDNLTSGTFDWEVSREGYYTETGSVQVDGNEEVTVILESSTYELEIVHEGTGKTGPAEGIHLIEKNTMVTLTAQTTSVSIFIKWEIDGEEYLDEEIEFLMDSDKVVTAFFENLPSYMLTIIIEGEGITDPEEGEYHYAYDEVITLTATPASDIWVFVKWVVDDMDYFESEINVLINSDKIVRAIFVDNVNYSLYIDYDGVGTINPAAGVYTYAAGTEITLSAQPGQNYIFDRWEINGVEYTDPVVTLIMNEDKVARTFFDLENFIPELINERHLILYPVPAKDKLNLRFEIGIENVRIEIYDINGRLIIKKDLLDIAAGQATTFDISSFETGVYNMNIFVKTHVMTRRFIVN